MPTPPIFKRPAVQFWAAVGHLTLRWAETELRIILPIFKTYLAVEVEALSPENKFIIPSISQVLERRASELLYNFTSAI